MAPMAETMPACTVDSTSGAIVAVRRASRDVGQLFERALVVFAFVAAACFAFVAVAHLFDRAFITYQAGSRMGLALYAREGILYPPFVHEGFYGGTRMMPVPIPSACGYLVRHGRVPGLGEAADLPVLSGPARDRLQNDAELGLLRCPIGGAVGRGHDIGGRDLDLTHDLV